MLTDEARLRGQVVPTFRSPPRVAGRLRTIRRGADGRVTVSIVVRHRPWSAVLADMVDGIVATNRLGGAEAEQLREQLWWVLDAVDVRESSQAPGAMAPGTAAVSAA